MRAGQQAESLQDYDRAIVEYTKVLRDDPDNRDARQASSGCASVRRSST